MKVDGTVNPRAAEGSACPVRYCHNMEHSKSVGNPLILENEVDPRRELRWEKMVKMNFFFINTILRNYLKRELKKIGMHDDDRAHRHVGENVKKQNIE